MDDSCRIDLLTARATFDGLVDAIVYADPAPPSSLTDYAARSAEATIHLLVSATALIEAVLVTFDDHQPLLDSERARVSELEATVADHEQRIAALEAR